MAFNLTVCYGCYRYRSGASNCGGHANGRYVYEGAHPPTSADFSRPLPAVEAIEKRVAKLVSQRNAASGPPSVLDLLLEIHEFWPYAPPLAGMAHWQHDAIKAWWAPANANRPQGLDGMAQQLAAAPAIPSATQAKEWAGYWKALVDSLTWNVDELKMFLQYLEAEVPAAAFDLAKRCSGVGGNLEPKLIRQNARASATAVFRFLGPQIFAIDSVPSRRALEAQHAIIGNEAGPFTFMAPEDEEVAAFDKYLAYLTGLQDLASKAGVSPIPAHMDMAAWAFTYSCLDYEPYQRSYLSSGHPHPVRKKSGPEAKGCDNWGEFIKELDSGRNFDHMRWSLNEERWRKVRVNRSMAPHVKSARQAFEFALGPFIANEPVELVYVFDKKSFPKSAGRGANTVDENWKTLCELIQYLADVTNSEDRSALPFRFRFAYQHQQAKTPARQKANMVNPVDNLDALAAPAFKEIVGRPLPDDWKAVIDSNAYIHERLLYIKFKSGRRLWFNFDLGLDLYYRDALNQGTDSGLKDTFFTVQGRAF